MRGLRAVPLGAVAVAALAGASGATAGKAITVGPGAILKLDGSDIYCTVVKASKTITVACFHLPGGKAVSKRKGFAIFGSDLYAGVTPPGTNTPAKLLPEPSFKSVPAQGGHVARGQLVRMGVGDLAAVPGTHMGIYVTRAKGGGNAIGVVYLGTRGAPIVGEITAGISDHYVTLVRVTGASSSSVVYRHKVY